MTPSNNLFFRKNIYRSNINKIVRLINSKALSIVNCHFLPSYKLNYVKERAPRDDNWQCDANDKGNLAGFYCAFCNLKASCFLFNSNVQTMLTPIIIPDKNTSELGKNVHPTSKKSSFT